MKKFISNILVFSLLTYIILFVLDNIVTAGLKNSNAFIFENLTKIYKGNIHSDCIINGSSKALVQVSPIIIDSILNFNSYNFGMNGANFELQNLVYQLYRTHNTKPDYILQVIGNETFEFNEDLHEYKRFAPYLDDSLVQRVTRKYNGFSFADYHIPFLRYSGFSIEIFNGISNFLGLKPATNESYKFKGYIPKNIQWDNSFENFKIEYPDGKNIKIDGSLVSMFNKYIESCLKDSIKIILIYPPTYYQSHDFIKNRDEIITLYESIAKRYQIPFLNFSDSKLSYSKQYFYNSQHLNKKGAELFTKEICDNLIKIGVKTETKIYSSK